MFWPFEVGRTIFVQKIIVLYVMDINFRLRREVVSQYSKRAYLTLDPAHCSPGN